MRVDRLTKCLLVVATGFLALTAVRSTPPTAVAQEPAAVPAGQAQQPPAAGLARLQISATSNGFLAFDSGTGEVLRVTMGSEKVETLGTLGKCPDGKWQYRPAHPQRRLPPRCRTPPRKGAHGDGAGGGGEGDGGAGPVQARHGAVPVDGGGVAALIVQPTSVENWKGPYMKDGLPKDPWGNPYIYREPGKLNADGVDVLSFGPDLRDGGGDDILGGEGGEGGRQRQKGERRRKANAAGTSLASSRVPGESRRGKRRPAAFNIGGGRRPLRFCSVGNERGSCAGSFLAELLVAVVFDLLQALEQLLGLGVVAVEDGDLDLHEVLRAGRPSPCGRRRRTWPSRPRASWRPWRGRAPWRRPSPAASCRAPRATWRCPSALLMLLRSFFCVVLHHFHLLGQLRVVRRR